MTFYYSITSGGSDTNLQLESLAVARREWRRLNDERARLTPGQIIQRCAAVCANLGLSVSQLLGQNVPQQSEHIDLPQSMLRKMLAGTGLTRLEETVVSLLDQCEDIRHFGKTAGGKKHTSVAALTFQRTKEYFDATMQLWNVVIARYKQQPMNDLHDFTDIDDAVDNIEQYAHNGMLTHLPPDRN